MRRRLVPIVTLLLILVVPSLASATLIHNRDATDHTIKLEQGSGSISATVKANKAVVFRCASFPCKVKFGGDSITVRSASDDFVIKNGKLTRKAKRSASR